MSASSSSRPLPEGVDDLPPLTRHQVQVLDINGGADGHVRDLAVDVLDFDFDSAIRYVSRLPDPFAVASIMSCAVSFSNSPGAGASSGDRFAKSRWRARVMRAASPSNHPSK